jgi:PEP-CTERM motif
MFPKTMSLFSYPTSHAIRIFRFIGATGLLCLPFLTASADNMIFGPASGNWNIATAAGTNWTNSTVSANYRVPNSTDIAFVRGNKTATIDSLVPSISGLRISVNAAGVSTVTIANSGSLTVLTDLLMANVANTTTATLNVSSLGYLSVGTTTTVSSSGTATINTAGTAALGDVQISTGAGSGALNVTGGSLSASAINIGMGNGGTGAVSISGGVATVSGTTFHQVGYRLNSGTTSGTLLLSGGSLTIANGEGGLAIGSNNGATQNVTGSMTVSGGSYNGKFIVGGDGGGSGTGLLTIVGSQATLESSSTSGNGMDLRATGTIRFNLDNTGISTLDISESGLRFSAGSTFVVDGTNYTGGAATFTLIDAASFAGVNFSSVNQSVIGFNGYNATLFADALSSNIMLTVAVPEPSTILLLGMGLGFVLWRSRRAKVKSGAIH